MSVESQKGIITIHWCSVESQKSVIAVQQYTVYGDSALVVMRWWHKRDSEGYPSIKKSVIASWEPEGHYHYSMMFHWEPTGHYPKCTKSMAIAPFWFRADDMQEIVKAIPLLKSQSLSVESQKGIITIQWCFVEKQKGVIAVQSLWR